MTGNHEASTELIAFVDESKKPARDPLTGKALPRSWYAMAAVIVLAGDADDLRARLVEISHDCGKPLHYKDLSKPIRREALSKVVELTDWDAEVVEIERPVQIRHEPTVRRAVLAMLMRLVVGKHGVTSIVIESRSRRATTDTLDFDDRWLASELTRFGQLPDGVTITHRRKTEPLLWLPDLIVGARTDAVSRSDWRPWLEVIGRVSTHRTQPRWQP